MRLDLEEMENYPTNKIDGFRERIEKLMPSLVTHRCSEGVEGGFSTEWKPEPGWGMLLSISLWKSDTGRDGCGFGRTRETKTPESIMWYSIILKKMQEFMLQKKL
jgi:cyanophycin synthetase